MSQVGLLNGVIVPSQGRSGGIAMLWESDLNVELKSYTWYHIDAVVTDPTSGFKWRIIGYYNFLMLNFRCHGFVWGILMKSYQVPRNGEAQRDPNSRMRVLEEQLMFVAFWTLDMRDQILIGVTKGQLGKEFD